MNVNNGFLTSALVQKILKEVCPVRFIIRSLQVNPLDPWYNYYIVINIKCWLEYIVCMLCNLQLNICKQYWNSIQVYKFFWIKVLQNFREFLIHLVDFGMFMQYSCDTLKTWWRVLLKSDQKQEYSAEWMLWMWRIHVCYRINNTIIIMQLSIIIVLGTG